MSQILSDRISTPIGDMVLFARDNTVLLLEFDDQQGRIERESKRRFPNETVTPSLNPFGFSARIYAYFKGQLDSCDAVNTDGGGTCFQNRVWRTLRQIPCGTTISYSELAKRLGDPYATRAVGLANGRNPISVIVPCHRVIGADGAMTGYGGGVERKKWLLAHEGILLRGGRLAVQPDLFSSK